MFEIILEIVSYLLLIKFISMVDTFSKDNMLADKS